ncbi:hypothetical protein EAE96_001794 [Botrytis aclada]|nr:hypothetical protein EAE96_001794 [Botrytis aclada]
MATFQYVSVLEEIKQFVLNENLSYRGVCMETEFNETIGVCRIKHMVLGTATRDRQLCIDWDVWVHYFLEFNNAEAKVDIPRIIQIVGDGPRAQKCRLVEKKLVLSKFEEKNDWKTKIEKLEIEEKLLRDNVKLSWKTFMIDAIEKKKPSGLDFESIQRMGFVERVSQDYKDRADIAREWIGLTEIELEGMKEYAKKKNWRPLMSSWRLRLRMGITFSWICFGILSFWGELERKEFLGLKIGWQDWYVNLRIV